MKWSDGHPFTSAAFTFYFDDIASNKTITPVFPTMLSPSRNAFRVTAPDKRTVVFKFERPSGIFLEVMCFRGHYIYSPGHYLKQFHEKYEDKEAIVAKGKAMGLGLNMWHQVFLRMADLHENPELPTIRPWRIKVPPPASRLLEERNPYYWKVDPEGNQLPYIDRIATTIVQSREILNFKAIAGAVDMQARHISLANYTLFMHERTKKKRPHGQNYRVLADEMPGPTCIYLNQCSKDPAMFKLLTNRKFRIALSVAINRPELIESIFAGLAVPTNGVSSPLDPFQEPGMDRTHIKYDPGQANRLLDEVGLKRGPDGLRRMPDGKPFQQILNMYPSEGGAAGKLWELVARDWRAVGLKFMIKSEAARISRMRVANGNSDFWAYGTNGINWITDPSCFVAMSEDSYHAPLYGRYFARNGRSGVKPRAEFQRMIDRYSQLAQTADDPPRRLELGRSILRQWSEQCYIIGIARPAKLTIVSNRFKNMPDKMIHAYAVMAPGYLGVEQFYIDEE